MGVEGEVPAGEGGQRRGAGGLRAVSHRAFGRWQRFAAGRAAVVLLFVWAFAEATVWPILADFLLVALAVAAPARLPHLLGAIVAGMTLGGLVTVATAQAAPGFAMDLVRDLPLVTGAQVERAGDLLDEHGTVVGFLCQPYSGVPFKVWATVAGERALPVEHIVPAFVVGRAVRMAASGGIAAGLGRLLARRVRDWFVVLAPAYVLAFAAGLVQVMRR